MYVKIRRSNESFWVHVNNPTKNKTWTGIVNNDLLYTQEHGLKDGDTITFEQSEILDMLPDDTMTVDEETEDNLLFTETQ